MSHPRNGLEAMAAASKGGGLNKSRPRKGKTGNQSTTFVNHYYEGGLQNANATIKCTTETVTGHDVIPNINTPI